MLEWSIQEEQKHPSPSDPDNPNPSPKRRRLWWVVLIVAVLLIVVGAQRLIEWQVRDAENRVVNDLEQFIEREEQARRFGIEGEISQWAAEDVPALWRSRYEASFIAPPADPISVTISIISIELEGNDALIELQVGRQYQTRRYRQTESGWRRVPMNLAEGGLVQRELGGLAVTFYKVNDIFANDTVAQYHQLIALWEGWDGTLPTIKTIEIHNQEFDSPVAMQGHRLQITNPALVSVPAHWTLTGDEMVRYGMAREIGSRVQLNRLSERVLPGNDHLINALVTVTALRWALPESVYTPITHQWRALADSSVGEAFYGPPNAFDSIDPFAPTELDATLLLIADALYEQGGHSQIADFVRAMRTASGWDDVFKNATNLTLLEFETLALGGAIPEEILKVPNLTGAAVAVPYVRSTEHFQLQIESYPQPIWVHTNRDTQVLLEDGTAVEPECATVLDSMEIEGEWYESGLRFHATQIQAVAPLTLDSSTATRALRGTVFYETHYGVDDAAMPVTRLVGIDAERSQQTLWEHPHLTSNLLFPFEAQRAMVSNGIMGVATPLGQCHLQWIVRYTPEDGVIQRWLLHHDPTLAPLIYFWDDQRNVGLATSPSIGEGFGRHEYWHLRPDSNPERGKDYLPKGVPWMLRPGRDELLMYDMQMQRLFLYDLNQEQEIWRLVLETEHDWGMVSFDRTGQYLYVTMNRKELNPNDGLPEFSSIRRFDMETGESIEVWDEAMGGVSEGAVDMEGDDSLYIVAQRHDSDQVELLKFEAEAWSEVMSGTIEDTRFGGLQACGQGGVLLMQTDRLQEGMIHPKQHLYRFRPDGTFRRFSSLYFNTYPIAC